MPRALRLGARVLAIVGVVLAVLAVRAVTAARSELTRGDSLREGEDVDGAIVAYRRAARWYAPGNPYVPAALDRLEAIAMQRAEIGDRERSLAAWRSIRGAILSTRSVYTPHAERLRRAEDAIARERGAAAPATERAQTRARALRELRAPERPALGWTLVLLLGWLAWTGGAFAFAQRALDEEDRVQSKPARLWGTVIVVGFGLFVIGMALA